RQHRQFGGGYRRDGLRLPACGTVADLEYRRRRGRHRTDARLRDPRQSHAQHHHAGAPAGRDQSLARLWVLTPAIALAAGKGQITRSMTDFSPREIVSELDRFIIGQADAKRAVAIALRNRWRRLQLDEKLREEVLPKNILMIGPTGVGK